MHPVTHLLRAVLITAGTAVATASLVAVSVLAGGIATAQPGAPAAPGHRGTTVSNSVGASLIGADDVANNPQAYRGGYVVLQAWEYREIPVYRAHHPGITILMYKDMGGSYSDTCTDGCTKDSAIIPAGVGYHWAEQHHPGWFLHTASGERLTNANYPNLHPMDIRNRGYQHVWRRNVLRDLRSHDWDGVMVDDTLTYLSNPSVGGLVSTQIPTDHAQFTATASFLHHVGPRLERAGYAVIPNVTPTYLNWKSTLSAWTRWVSGWEDENFVSWSHDGSTPLFSSSDDWTWKMQMSSWLAARDKPMLAITYGTAGDTAEQTYHRATWLLTWNGHTGASIYVPTDPSAGQWLPAASVSVGRPTGARRVAHGVYQRAYSRGLVIVNPTRQRRLVHLRHGYVDHAGRAVDHVRLGGTSAVILRTG